MLVLFFGKRLGIVFVFSAFRTLVVHSRLPPINLNFFEIQIDPEGCARYGIARNGIL